MRLVHVGARTSQGASLIRRFRPVPALLSAGILMTGCGVLGGTSSSPGGSGNETITVAAVPGVDDAPLYVAQRAGLFRKHGLNVTIRDYTSAQQEIQALKSGHASIAAGDYANFFYAESHAQLAPKAPPMLRLIADGYDAAPNVMEVMTQSGSAITSPQMLAGKTIATPAPQAIPVTPNQSIPYSMEMLATQAVLGGDGVSASSITWDPMPEQDMISALQSGKVDAILVTEPYILQAETKLGAVAVLDSCSGVTAALPLLGYFSSNTFASGHPAAVQAFRSALLQAQTDAALRGPVQTTLVSSMGMTSQDADLLTLGDYPTFLSINQVQRVADLMYDAGMISSPLAVQTLVSK
jgi:NitT/TauT family transport system substrate-binding protein